MEVDILLPAPTSTHERNSQNQDCCWNPCGELDCLHDIFLLGMRADSVILADNEQSSIVCRKNFLQRPAG
jgi:hypothetical protein